MEVWDASNCLVTFFNKSSACPIEANVPIEAEGIIPVSPTDVAGIPDIALSIPDFEGEAVLRIFSNSTQSEIACFAAQITNGNSFSHPVAVGSVLGIVTLIAALSSFATAVYGDNISIIRKHYGHSVSVLVVFAVWHHIFYSGALSVNWPSVLIAFWSNYAWAAGMIYSEHMQNAVNDFIGLNKGNTSQVGAARTGVGGMDSGRGYDIKRIDKRHGFSKAFVHTNWKDQPEENIYGRHLKSILAKREFIDANKGFAYYGQPVKPGLPLPGSHSGFAGVLAHEHIPASNAFMTSFLWFLVLIVGVATSVFAIKLILEGLLLSKLLKHDCMSLFRRHYLGYTVVIVLRAFFVSFFTMVFLAMFQFSYLASPGPIAVACVVFLIMLIGLGGLVGYACFYKLKDGDYLSAPDRLNIRETKAFRLIPWYEFIRESKSSQSKDKPFVCSIRWWRTWKAQEEKSIHEDGNYTRKFGWLASRFRRTRWWFFAVWLVYEFVRACFLAGASVQPTIQVFGLVAVEVVAFGGMVYLRPFEGQRLNAIAVYLLGFSKVAITALSAAFDTRFNLPRIPATVIGVVIIAIQGLLTVATIIIVIAGAVTSYISVMRNCEEMRPRGWNPIRRKYFEHVDFRLLDIPRPSVVSSEPTLKVPREPYFDVRAVRRIAKIEDEDEDFIKEIQNDASTTRLFCSNENLDGMTEPLTQRSRAASVQSRHSYSSLPRGARVHRANWSSRDFGEGYAAGHDRALSNSMPCTPGGPGFLSNRSLLRLNTQLDSPENLERPALFTHSQRQSVL